MTGRSRRGTQIGVKVPPQMLYEVEDALLPLDALPRGLARLLRRGQEWSNQVNPCTWLLRAARLARALDALKVPTEHIQALACGQDIPPPPPPPGQRWVLKKIPKTAAERQQLYRERQRAQQHSQLPEDHCA